jgi:hypothetical protein
MLPNPAWPNMAKPGREFIGSVLVGKMCENTFSFVQKMRFHGRFSILQTKRS